MVKKIFIAGLLIGYPVYFGFAMKLNSPFNFPSGVNSTVIIDDYVFSNNRGLAFLVLNFIACLFLLWDMIIKRFIPYNPFTFSKNYFCESSLAMKFRKFSKWLVFLNNKLKIKN